MKEKNERTQSIPLQYHIQLQLQLQQQRASNFRPKEIGKCTHFVLIEFYTKTMKKPSEKEHQLWNIFFWLEMN